MQIVFIFMQTKINYNHLEKKETMTNIFYINYKYLQIQYK